MHLTCTGSADVEIYAFTWRSHWRLMFMWVANIVMFQQATAYKCKDRHLVRPSSGDVTYSARHDQRAGSVGLFSDVGL